MGCGNSKVLPAQSDGLGSQNIVKPVPVIKQFPSDPEPKKKGNFSNKFTFGKGFFDDDDEEDNKKAKLANNNNKLMKYKAKFDPRVVAKYDIRALIGRGSFSRVVRAEHKGTKQPCAIKMIEGRQREGRSAANAELRVLRRVRHPYVVQLIEVFEAPDKIYMVMELATGGELFERVVSQGSFSEKDAIYALQMVLQGLRYLHGLGITHRDLKPENLLYHHPGNDSKLLITDFGLASTRRSGDDVTMKTTCGTPEYIAPEVLLRKPYSNAVDCWSLGVISYILLSGTMPFDDENKTRLYRMILKGEYDFNSDAWREVSSQAKDFVSSFLTVNPEKRFSCAQGLRHDWITHYTNSSSRNIHRTISRNLLKRASSRNSDKSAQSGRSSKSNRSLRSQHRKVKAKELDDLLKKYSH